MAANDDYTKAMKFQHPQYIPVDVSVLPATWMKYRENLDALVRRHPLIFRNYNGRNYDEVGGTYVEGNHVDEWGCVWSNLHTGMEAIVTHHPVPTRQDVHKLKAPAQVTPNFPTVSCTCVWPICAASRRS